MVNKNILIIGGFDPSCGAGILNDFKVCNHLKINPYCITTSIAVQNHNKGFKNFAISKEILKMQLNAIFEEAEIEFCKIGMVQSLELAKVLIKELTKRNIKIILDTPLKASNGSTLQEKEVVLLLAKHSFLVTPNKEEFEQLKPLNGLILVKSFVTNKGKISDVLLAQNKKVKTFSNKFLNLPFNVRGTGCALSTAICCFLFKGEALNNAIKKAQKVVLKGMKNATNQAGKGVLFFF